VDMVRHEAIRPDLGRVFRTPFTHQLNVDLAYRGTLWVQDECVPRYHTIKKSPTVLSVYKFRDKIYHK